MQRKWKNATRHKPKFTKIHWHLTNADRQLSFTCYSKIYATEKIDKLPLCRLNNGRFRCCDSVTLTIKSTLEPYYFLKHKTKPFNFHLPWFFRPVWLQTRKKRSTKRREPQRAFQRGKSKSKQYTSSRYTRFRVAGEGLKYSAKTCDVSFCRQRVFSFPVIYSGYVRKPRRDNPKIFCKSKKIFEIAIFFSNHCRKVWQI